MSFIFIIYFWLLFYVVNVNGCCEICGADYIEFEGRCLHGELIRGDILLSTKDPYEYPDSDAACCKLCGLSTENWELDDPTVGFVKCSKPRTQNLRAVGMTLQNLKCQACEGLLKIIHGAKDFAIDTIQEMSMPYCNALLLFRGLCKNAIKNSMESIIEHINNGMSKSNICGRMLKFCPYNSTMKSTSLKYFIVPSREVLSNEDILAKDPWSFLSLNSELNVSSDATLEFMAKHGLISNTQICPKCQPITQMTLTPHELSHNKFQWQCSSCDDNGNVQGDTFIAYNPEYNSLFSGIKCKFDDIVRVLFVWSKHNDYTITSIARETGVSSHNILIDLFQHIRDVCQSAIFNGKSNYQVTGDVELLESIYYKDTYKRSTAHNRVHSYAFIFFERSTLQYSIATVERKSLDSLAQAIVDCVDPSATIYADFYEKFGGISAVKMAVKKLSELSKIVFENETMPHQETEQKWYSLKNEMKRLQKHRRQLTHTFIFQFLFKRIHHDHGILQHLMVAIRQQNQNKQQLVKFGED